MATVARGRGGRGRGRGGGRPTAGGEPVSWDFSNKTTDSHGAQDTFFPDIELPETDPPNARELQMVENYRMLRKRLHNDMQGLGWLTETVATQHRYPGDIKGRKDPFNALQSYSQRKYQKKREHESHAVLKIRWDPKRYNLQNFPKRLRKVIDRTYDPVTDTTAATRAAGGEQTAGLKKRKRVIEDSDDEDNDTRAGEDDDEVADSIDDEDPEEPDPDDTFSSDDEEMAGDYGNNYFDNGEDDEDVGGDADEGGGGDDYE